MAVLKKLEINDDLFTPPKYYAGENVQISPERVISATDTTYTAGEGININNGVISATGASVPTYTAAEIDAMLADVNGDIAQNSEDIDTNTEAISQINEALAFRSSTWIAQFDSTNIAEVSTNTGYIRRWGRMASLQLNASIKAKVTGEQTLGLQLPRWMWPTSNIFVIQTNQSGGPYLLTIKSNGDVTINFFTAHASSFVFYRFLVTYICVSEWG